MTDPMIRLEPARLVVEPGGQVRAQVIVRNLSPIVEGYRIDVLAERDGRAEPIPWAEVVPPEVRVDVGSETSAAVVFSPPSGSSAVSGVMRIGVRAISLVDPTSSAVAEGELEIGRVHGLGAKLTPVTSTGRWSARHRLELTNWGNAPVRLQLSAGDPDERLAFLLTPDVVDVPLAGLAEAKVLVRTRKPRLRGSAQRMPFQVLAEPQSSASGFAPRGPGAPDPNRQIVEAAFVQLPIISRWVMAVLGLLIAGLIAGAVYLVRSAGSDDGTDDGTDGGSAPSVPTGVTVDPAGPGELTVTWAVPERSVDSHQIQTVDPISGNIVDSIDVPGAQNAETVGDLEPSTEYCFKVVAIRDDVPSAATEQVCNTTSTVPPTSTEPDDSASPSVPPSSSDNPSGSPSDTPSEPGQSGPEPGQFIVVVMLFDETLDDDAAALVASLQAEDHAADQLLSADYADMYQDPRIVVFVGPFDVADDATAYCNGALGGNQGWDGYPPFGCGPGAVIEIPQRASGATA